MWVFANACEFRAGVPWHFDANLRLSRAIRNTCHASCCTRYNMHGTYVQSFNNNTIAPVKSGRKNGARFEIFLKDAARFEVFAIRAMRFEIFVEDGTAILNLRKLHCDSKFSYKMTWWLEIFAKHGARFEIFGTDGVAIGNHRRRWHCDYKASKIALQLEIFV